MADQSDLLRALAPLLEVVAGVDPDADTALPTLQTRLPPSHPDMQAVARLVREGIDAGWLVPRNNEEAGIRYGRLAKATPGTHDLSIDAVEMASPGPGHAHPNGEIDLCFALDGDPTFDGQPPGWVVKKRGSWHIPTVRGGRMGILYFLPGGAIDFGARP